MLYFIVNTRSRTGKAQEIWEELEQELKKRNVEYEAVITEYEGHARELASRFCFKPGQVRIVVVGGDGTANEVVDGMHDFQRVELAYIPTGSGNDLARGLKITGKPLEVLDHILASHDIMPMDLGEVSFPDGSSRRFAISGGLGVDANVCKQALTSKLKVFLNKLHLGHLTYVLLTVKTVFTMPLTDAEISLEDGSTRTLHNVIFMAAMNHACEGGGVPMAPRASATDGLLSVCCVYGVPRGVCLLFLPVLCMGKHEKIKGFEVFDCTQMHVRLKNKMIVHTDGEYCGEPREVTFRCIPGICRIVN